MELIVYEYSTVEKRNGSITFFANNYHVFIIRCIKKRKERNIQVSKISPFSCSNNGDQVVANGR